MIDLTFDAVNHRYFADGVLVPSVTQILSDVGLWPDYSRFDSWYAERGTKIHKAVALFDRGRLDWDKLDHHIIGFIQSYSKWKEQFGYVPFQSETPMYNAKLKYAGTPDSYGKFNKNAKQLHIPRLVDVKGGAPCIFFGLQLAGYALMLKDHYSFLRTTVHLQEDGSVAFHRLHSGVDDFAQFKAAVTVYHSKRRLQ